MAAIFQLASEVRLSGSENGRRDARVPVTAILPSAAKGREEAERKDTVVAAFSS